MTQCTGWEQTAFHAAGPDRRTPWSFGEMLTPSGCGGSIRFQWVCGLKFPWGMCTQFIRKLQKLAARVMFQNVCRDGRLRNHPFSALSGTDSFLFGPEVLNSGIFAQCMAKNVEALQPSSLLLVIKGWSEVLIPCIPFYRLFCQAC